MSIQTIVKSDGTVRYEMTEPFDIGPRLEPSLKLSDGSRVSIQVHGRTDEGRIRYSWAIDDANGSDIGHGSDIESGVSAAPDVESAFQTFASFVGAWVEALDHDGSDNADIFPESMRDWAQANDEELYMYCNEDGE